MEVTGNVTDKEKLPYIIYKEEKDKSIRNADFLLISKKCVANIGLVRYNKNKGTNVRQKIKRYTEGR